MRSEELVVNRQEFGLALLQLWNAAHDIPDVTNAAGVDFAEWSGATKDLLLSLGLEGDSEKQDYRLPDVPSCSACQRDVRGVCVTHLTSED